VDGSHSKHSGVISAFRKYFIKTGSFPVEYSKIYGRLLEDRHEGDYLTGSSISKVETVENLADAEHFITGSLTPLYGL
jgi:uncharacterized protein (UPF0332 family)